MGSINKNEITAEMMKKAMECKTADELVELAKSEGFEITKEEAEKYLEELGGTKLDDEDLDMVAGGGRIGLPCLKGDTRILLADGTYKRVCEVQDTDMVAAWDFERGCLTSVPITHNHVGSEVSHDAFTVHFADGTEVGAIGEHSFFDMTTGQYAIINNFTTDAAQFIGHEFAKVGADGTISRVRLVDITFNETTEGFYNPLSQKHLNVITEGMLSVTGFATCLYNYFDVDVKKMAYDSRKREADIARYGVLDYDREGFKSLFSREIFDANEWKYLSVSFAKTPSGKEQFRFLCQRFGKFFVEHKAALKHIA